MSAIETLKTDVAAMIDEAVKDLDAAIAAAVANSNDPAIAELDAKVKETTQTLKDKFATAFPPAPVPAPAPEPAPTPAA